MRKKLVTAAVPIGKSSFSTSTEGRSHTLSLGDCFDD